MLWHNFKVSKPGIFKLNSNLSSIQHRKLTLKKETEIKRLLQTEQYRNEKITDKTNQLERVVS